jgi:site-specific DNA-methyltransferase (cytosine-N4-specific)
VGTREIRRARREALVAEVRDNPDIRLPAEVTKLCRHLADELVDSRDGFRRQNMPALAYQYFTDMATVFGNVRTVLKPGSAFAVVVGPNNTTINGDLVLIDTPKLVAATAVKAGWRLERIDPLDTYPRYDLHQRNSIRSESLLVFRS